MSDSYSNVRDHLIADSAGNPNRAADLALPPASQFRATLPDYYSLTGNVSLTRANAKAIGYTGYATTGAGATDATITFNMSSGYEDVTSDGTLSLRMSTGKVYGDGNQASHWKDDDLTGQFIGIMDPTLSPGVAETVDSNDLFAMSLIGYDPPPSRSRVLGWSCCSARARSAAGCSGGNGGSGVGMRAQCICRPFGQRRGGLRSAPSDFHHPRPTRLIRLSQ